MAKKVVATLGVKSKKPLPKAVLKDISGGGKTSMSFSEVLDFLNALNERGLKEDEGGVEISVQLDVPSAVLKEMGLTELEALPNEPEEFSPGK